MKKNIFAILLIIALAITSSHAQVGIGVATANINPSAQLEVVSTAKGFLPPRMTEAERNLIPVTSASAGLIVYCKNCGPNGEMQYYNGSSWTNMVGAAAAATDLTPRVTIGNQVWTAQNLNVSAYRDGTPIPKVEDAATWASLTTGAYCYYNNDSASYASIYGKLYNWYAVVGIYDALSLSDSSLRKNLAPAGYKIPTDGDWVTLTNTLGYSTSGIQMKSTILWNSNGNGTGNGTNSSGFAGLPGGYRSNNGTTFGNIGNNGYWWSSTEFSTSNAWYNILSYNVNILGRAYFNDDESYGFSVRCLRD